jgi:hypothetical protein
VEAHDRLAAALVDVVQAQAADLRVVRLELVSWERVEAFLWSPEHVQEER